MLQHLVQNLFPLGHSHTYVWNSLIIHQLDSKVAIPHKEKYFLLLLPMYVYVYNIDILAGNTLI